MATKEANLRYEILYYPFMGTSINTENLIMLARLCYSPMGVGELQGLIRHDDPAKTGRFIRDLIQAGHLGALEHWYTTFAVEGYSRISSQQNDRHRLVKMFRESGVSAIVDDGEQGACDTSQLQQSQRYVGETDFNYVIPKSFTDHPDYLARYIKLQEEVQRMQLDGMALGLPPEDVRYSLTNATETRFVITTNARQLRHMLNLRCCRRAQWEIRELFMGLLIQYQKIAPNIFWRAGPSCEELGYCPEDKHSCGYMPTAKKRRNGE